MFHNFFNKENVAIPNAEQRSLGLDCNNYIFFFHSLKVHRERKSEWGNFKQREGWVKNINLNEFYPGTTKGQNQKIC